MASPDSTASTVCLTIARMESFNRRARQEATLVSNLEGILRGSDLLIQVERQFSAAMAGAYVAGLTDAAPDLLAALRDLMDQPTENPLSLTPAERKSLWAAHDKARAAIAKAEGRS